MKFYSYSEFLFEKLEINTLNDVSKVFHPIFKEAKKTGPIKYFTETNTWQNEYASLWRNENSLGLTPLLDVKSAEEGIHFLHKVFKVLFDKNEYAEFFLYDTTNYLNSTGEWAHSDDKKYEFLMLGAWNDHSLDSKIIEKVFIDEINASLKNITWSIKPRKLTVPETEKLINKKLDKNLNYISFYYEGDPSVLDTSITVEDVKNTSEYKELMKWPIDMISTPKQLKNMTLVFGFNSGTVFGESSDHKENEKYLRVGYALFKRGYVRSMPLWGGGQAAPVSNFNSNTIEGWKKGLSDIKNRFEKYINVLQKRGLEIYYKPEDIDRKKGKIAGKKYGI